MVKLITPVKSIGLEKTSQFIKIAQLQQGQGKPVVVNLEKALKEDFNVKPLYKGHPFLVTGLEGNEVLLRNLHLPLTKEKDIDAALIFQVEPLLPYPIDEAILTKQLLEKTSDESDLLIFATKKNVVENHLNNWSESKVDPEQVSCIQMALNLFAKHFLPQEKPLILVHIQDQNTVCALVKNGKLISAFTQAEGLNSFTPLPVIEKMDEKQSEEDLDEITENLSKSSLTELEETPALLKIQRSITKMCLALAKELKSEEGEVLLTGDGASVEGLKHYLFKNLPLKQLEAQKDDNHSFSWQEQLSYAVPIGLALNGFPAEKDSINFRQNEFSYAKTTKRLTKPLTTFVASILLLTAATYGFGQYKLHVEENSVKQNYVDLLASMGKSYDQFEAQYLNKNPLAKEKSEGEILPIDKLNVEDLQDRLAFINKDINSVPDTFPLYANVPTASDVLAWLSSHAFIAPFDDSGKPETRLQLENFSYQLVKRPDQAKKQEKYQVKIELEFSTTIPKWAREFHDALIAPNDFVDPKGEIKWNSNRNKYKTSFFLKDKTSYL